jgi:hypothetical protein
MEVVKLRSSIVDGALEVRRWRSPRILASVLSIALLHSSAALSHFKSPSLVVGRYMRLRGGSEFTFEGLAGVNETGTMQAEVDAMTGSQVGTRPHDACLPPHLIDAYDSLVVHGCIAS